ncbi:MAG: hypothetical protein PHD01_05435 [Geobacteraceae bacterium]|nr:hypothetical protein [Geobacteraceae bacterium]
MGHVPDSRDQFLSAREARKFAIDGFVERRWAFPPEYSRAMKDTEAGNPLLVERIDRKDSFYYIVPFERKGKASVLVMIDARTGAFKEAAYFAEPTAYLPVSNSEARKKLVDFLGLTATEAESAQFVTSLVWKPSEASQSPFEPFWRFRTGEVDRYVDQKGNVHLSIEAPRMKGG